MHPPVIGPPSPVVQPVPPGTDSLFLQSPVGSPTNRVGRSPGTGPFPTPNTSGATSTRAPQKSRNQVKKSTDFVVNQPSSPAISSYVDRPNATRRAEATDVEAERNVSTAARIASSRGQR